MGFFPTAAVVNLQVCCQGVKLILVNPAYTSQTCHKCLHVHPVKGKSYRNGKTFRCGHCNWKGDADYNGAKNIAALGSIVNRPGGNGLFCKVTDNIEYIQLTVWDWLRATESSRHTT